MIARYAPGLYLARLDLRIRWRSLLVLAILVGVVAGALLACAAAARRTESAFDRLRGETRAADLYFSVDGDEAGELEELPGVESAVPVRFFSGRFETGDGRVLQDEDFTGTSELTVFASSDPRFGTEVDLLEVVSGRAADPSQPYEVVVDDALARETGLRPGDVIVERFALGGDEEAPPYEVAYDVVGIVITSMGVRPPTGGGTSAIFAGPGLVEAIDVAARDAGFDGVPGCCGVALTFDPGADRSVLDGTLFAERVFLDMDAKALEIDGGTEGDTLMLLVIFALGSVGAFLVLSPVIARAESVAQRDALRLRTLGLTRRDLTVRGVMHGSTLAVCSAVLAIAVATFLSRFAPIAEARRFEVDEGFDVDLAVLLPGALAVAVVVTAVVTLSARRATATVGRRAARSSTVARLLGSERIGPVGSLGLRMGFGGGGTSGSGAGYFAAIALGIAAVAAAATFAHGLTHLERTPELVGANLDLLMFPGDDDEDPGWAETRAALLLDQDEIDVAGAGTFFPPDAMLGEDGLVTWLMTYQTGERAWEPVVVEGRAPIASHELLVHPNLLRALGEIGDTIRVSGGTGGTGDDGQEQSAARIGADFKIVGTGVITTEDYFKSTSAITYDGLLRLFGPDNAADVMSPHVVRARFREGVDREDAFARLSQIGVIGEGQTVVVAEIDSVARDVVRLDLAGPANVPRVLAILLGAIGASVLALMLTDRVRAWRRRLAVHSALGLTGWQIRAGVTVAALITTLGAVAIAVPLGVAAGRALWLRHADRLGVVPESPVPWTALVSVATGSLAVAALIALRPAWVAGRRRGATALRAE